VADFHSLRGYFVSALVRAGASIKTVQTLARHAKPQATLTHYARVSVRDPRGAVESLPTPAATDPEPLAATGTDPVSQYVTTRQRMDSAQETETDGNRRTLVEW
jgi:hypothetical protein